LNQQGRLDLMASRRRVRQKQVPRDAVNAQEEAQIRILTQSQLDALT